jgi:hypothetical protein
MKTRREICDQIDAIEASTSSRADKDAALRPLLAQLRELRHAEHVARWVQRDLAREILVGR